MARRTNPVLDSAHAVAEHSQHVKLDRAGCKAAANKIYTHLVATPYTAASWAAVPLHPVPAHHSPASIVDFIFLVSTLNFSFWSDRPATERFGVRYKTAIDGKEVYVDSDQGHRGVEQRIHTGYTSLLVALHRAKDEGVDVTNPRWYKDATDDEVRRVFRSDQSEEMPLLDERIRVMREVGTELCERFDGSFTSVIQQANHSALDLIDLVVNNFPCFDDKSTYPALGDAPIYIRKRAQILVAEIWAALEGQGYGRFDDIDQITMFADYRVPQILHSLSTISYSPHLTNLLTSHANLPQGSPEEVEIRCLSIVAVEEIRSGIVQLVADAATASTQADGLESSLKPPNAVLLDFLLWDLAKVEEAEGRAQLPHHRTRSIYY